MRMTALEYINKITAALRPMDADKVLDRIPEVVAVKFCGSRHDYKVCDHCRFRKGCSTILLIEARREILRLREIEKLYELMKGVLAGGDDRMGDLPELQAGSTAEGTDSNPC